MWKNGILPAAVRLDRNQKKQTNRVALAYEKVPCARSKERLEMRERGKGRARERDNEFPYPFPLSSLSLTLVPAQLSLFAG